MFYYNVENKFFIDWNKIKINITSADEFYIINEIFVKQIYNYNTLRDCIVVDIGMNVGLASIFFAKNTKVKKVYGFEPFKQTYQQACYNFSLNEPISNKIIPANFGISQENKFRDLVYNFEYKGSVGLYGYASTNTDSAKLKETIELKDVNSIISLIRKENPEKYDYIFKIDCEGDEYDIIQRLIQDEQLLPNVIMLEWHKNGPEAIIRDLVKTNFEIFSFYTEDNFYGFLYCIRRNIDKVSI